VNTVPREISGASIEDVVTLNRPDEAPMELPANRRVAANARGKVEVAVVAIFRALVDARLR